MVYFDHISIYDENMGKYFGNFYWTFSILGEQQLCVIFYNYYITLNTKGQHELNAKWIELFQSYKFKMKSRDCGQGKVIGALSRSHLILDNRHFENSKSRDRRGLCSERNKAP